MSVDLKTIEKIALLARIEVPQNQLKDYQDEINQVLDLVDEMQQLDLEKVEPMFHPIEIDQLLTQDQPNREPIDQSIFENAPKSDKHYFLVPKVIE